MNDSGLTVEIVVMIIAEQASRKQIDDDAAGSGGNHRRPIDGNRMETALNPFDDDDGGRHQNQNGIQQ